MISGGDRFERWLAAARARALAEVTPAELGRSVRALSALYVHRRDRLADGAPLDGRGKRGAFASVYAPLHFETVRRIVGQLPGGSEPLDGILDLGCGTAAAGAGWAVASGTPRVDGVERNGWAVEEGRRTLADLGLAGKIVRGDVATALLPTGRGGVCLGWVVNELDDATRGKLLPKLIAAATRGTRALVVEPIAARPVRWWDEWAGAFAAAGGRGDLWRFPAELPELLVGPLRSAGLDPRELTARSLWHPGGDGSGGAVAPPGPDRPSGSA